MTLQRRDAKTGAVLLTRAAAQSTYSERCVCGVHASASGIRVYKHVQCKRERRGEKAKDDGKKSILRGERRVSPPGWYNGGCFREAAVALRYEQPVWLCKQSAAGCAEVGRKQKQRNVTQGERAHRIRRAASSIYTGVTNRHSESRGAARRPQKWTRGAR